jgi:Transposase DDE domain group 1
MATECRQDSLDFGTVEGRSVVGAFDGGVISSDAGALLLSATDRAIGLVRRYAACFSDGRNPELIEHKVETLVGQRVFGIALSYEDLIDHDELRHDPVMAVLAGKLKARRKECAPVAGKSTLSRLEHAPEEGLAFAPPRYHKISHDGRAIEELFVTLFLEAHRRRPKRIILDLDATDSPLHGHQEGRFFHGFYDCYCYLPLYIFCGRHLLAAKLRRSNIDASAGSVEEVSRVIAQIRSRWRKVEIWLRADSGFAREELMAWCEENRVHYVFGLAKNERLAEQITQELEAAETEAKKTGAPARRFKEFMWETLDSWSRKRRVIGKAEWTKGEANPRFIVTSLNRTQVSAQTLYVDIYCQRGDMENRIKECQSDLFADRTPAATMRANQLRLWFASMAYVLMCALRRIGLAGSELARATCGTIRLKLLKIGAQVTISVRRVKIAFASSYPGQQIFALAHDRLRHAAA